MFVTYADKFVPVYKSGVYREFKAINFGDLLKACHSLYQYKFNECRSFCVTQTKECLITIRAIEKRG
jgi:hypothetical protein